MKLKSTSPDFDGAQIDVYLQNENLVSMPKVTEGEAVDFSDHDSVWLSAVFADAWEIKVGDEFAYQVMGVSVTKKVRGLISLQNICLSVIGIFLGSPFAKSGLKMMIDNNGEGFDYSASIPFFAYLISGAAILLVSMDVSFMFSKRIKHIDMVETLKGME